MQGFYDKRGFRYKFVKYANRKTASEYVEMCQDNATSEWKWKYFKE